MRPSLLLVFSAFFIAAPGTATPTVAQRLPSWAEAPQARPPTPAAERDATEPSYQEEGPPPFPVPLDPLGLAALALAGGAYGARRLRRRNACVPDPQ